MNTEEILKRRKEYREKRNELNSQVEEEQLRARHYHEEAKRISSVLDNPRDIIENISQDFEKGTTFSKREYMFLFFATALQCIRWMFQPNMEFGFEKISNDQRHCASKDGIKEFQEAKKYTKENYDNLIKSRKYPDKAKMFLLPVPYDAMKGTKNIIIPGVSDIGKNISGVNHHAATLGHDPILGYVFGTINIMTRTITFKNPTLSTNIVRLVQGSEKNQYVADSIGFFAAVERMVESAKEDIGRIPAAVVRQALHIQSDKYTKEGLPIPIISADKAQYLLNKGWNSYELERLVKHIAKNTATLGIQLLLSYLINVIIEILYKLSCDDDKDDLALFEVKSRKIITYSNIIASTSNVIYALVSENISKLDVGGIINTIYRLVTDTKIINQIRDEYIYGGFEKQLEIREYTI